MRVGAVPPFTIDGDTVTIGDATLHMAHRRPVDAWRTRPESALLLYKGPRLLGVLDRFFRASAIEPKAIVELGIWDGGSAAFWFEYFRPDKLVAIDILDREDAPAFRAYVQRNGLAARLRTYWRTDQADRERLGAIVSDEFAGPLDLVIDDASHERHATRASFETLFPRLRSGGLYLIEDWAWEVNAAHGSAGGEGLIGFVRDLVDEAARGAVRRLTVSRGLAVAERA